MKLLLSFFTLCSLAGAQSTPSVKTSDVPARKEQVSIKPDVTRPSADTPTPTPTSSAKYEYFTNVTIAAGQIVNLDSAIDYSSSDTVSVTVRSPKGDTAGLIGTAYFTVPNATEYVTQDAFSGQNFNYSNTGGATFQVCGPQFRFTLQNLSSSTITLSSVLIYTHSF